MKNKINYGIDAPEIIINRIIVGVVFIVLAMWISNFYRNSIFLLRVGLKGIMLILALYLIMSSIIMLFSSKYGKLKEVNRVIEMLDIKGNEKILDLGCGRGLYLINIAKKLTCGHAIGLDLWTKDLSNNCLENTLNNVSLEKVEKKVEIKTGDMTQIPYKDNYFDLIVSSFAINNILEKDKREVVIQEIVRVLKKGGRFCIIDMRNIDEYIDNLRKNDILEIKVIKSKYIYPKSKILIGKKKN